MDQERFNQLIMTYGRKVKPVGTAHRSWQVKREGRNSLCGDHASVYMNRSPKGYDILVESDGCMVCRASSNILEDSLTGLDRETVRKTADAVIESFESDGETHLADVGESIKALIWLKRFPVRKKCAMISWRALSDALSAEEMQ